MEKHQRQTLSIAASFETLSNALAPHFLLMSLSLLPSSLPSPWWLLLSWPQRSPHPGPLSQQC